MIGKMDGILVINKPSGMTSHDVIIQLRRILHEKKIGHTGTLDPDATGVLPVCIGKATKIIQFLEDKEKGYEGTITLGIETDSMDASGVITSVSDSSEIKSDDVENALKKFVGEIDQIPPMVSAKKINGERLYKLARQGKTVDRKPVRISIDSFELTKFYKENIPEVDEHKTFAKFNFSVLCSRGTYVRALASDIGDALGCGAHLSRLVRTRSGRFMIEDSIGLDEIKADPQIAISLMISIDNALSSMPAIIVNEIGKRKFTNGVQVDITDILSCDSEIKANDIIRIHDNSGMLLGIGEAFQSIQDIIFRPVKVFFTNEN
jgi:tRNA pseudouridine55 synthase